MSSGLGHVLRVGLSRTRLELADYFRDKQSLIFGFTFPLILLFVLGSILSGDLGQGVSFKQYFVAGMIASGFMNSGFQSLAIAIPIERDNGTLKRLMGTPMPRASYFIGKIGLILVASAGQIVLLVGVGSLLYGLHLPSTPGKWVTFLWLAVLGSAAFTVLGIAFSSVPRNGKSAPAVVSPVALVLQFFSGVFAVYSDLPHWMQQIAAIFPLKWLTQGMRSVFLPDSFKTSEVAGSWEHGRTALVLVAWIVIGLAISLRTFRWQKTVG